MNAAARLKARPRQPNNGSAKPGLHSLSLTARRDALLYVPKATESPVPLVVSLHGAGGNERHGIELLREQADSHGVIIVAPASRGTTWDIIEGAFGSDVTFIDTMLARTFDMCGIDPKRVAIGGFSDGASYALTLGLPNGDLFSDVLAFSPGFTAHPATVGKPEVFVSHGTEDTVLPIARCSRRLVPRLKTAGYKVDYREFNGPHTVPKEMRVAAIEQLVSR